MAGKALCQDPSKGDGKIKRKKEKPAETQAFFYGVGSHRARRAGLRPSQGLAPSEGCFRPPQGLAPLCKGSWQGRQALTEGLWVSCRNGLPITGDLLLYLTYNPSASHPLSTSPYTGEARGGRRSLVPSSPVLRPKRRGFTGGTWFRPSDRARPALRCRPAFPQKRPRSRGGSGGHFDFPAKQVLRGLRARRRGPERASGRPPAFTARTWPPGAPPNSPGCASGWCCRPPE